MSLKVSKVISILAIIYFAGLVSAKPMSDLHHDDHPEIFVINTPYGPQTFIHQTAPDGSQYWQSISPGHSHTTYTSGGNDLKETGTPTTDESHPNNGFHYSHMSDAHPMGNGFYSGSYSSMGNMGGMGGMGGMGSMSGMGNMGSMSGMSMGMGMGGGMSPMKPFKWWPSIFSNNND